MICNVSLGHDHKYKSIPNSPNFKGSVGEGMQKFIEDCARGECNEYLARNVWTLEENALVDACGKITEKWTTLLDELFEKMSKQHKKSVLDYVHKHLGDMDGNSEGLIEYYNPKLYKRLKRLIKYDEPSMGGFARPKNSDPDFLGYSEVIMDKNGEEHLYGEIWNDCRESIEKYPYDIIFDNIKDFAQKADDAEITKDYKENPLSKKSSNIIKEIWQEVLSFLLLD